MPVYMQALEGTARRQRFEAVYTAYQGRLLALVRRYLPAREDAEDAVQQPSMAVAERFDRLEHLPPPELEAYLVVTAERKAIDILRHQAKRGGVPFDEATPLVTPAPCGNPLADPRARLPPRYREALLLRYGCGYDTRETAALLGLSVAAAQKTMQRAKRALQKELEKEEAEV